MVSFPSTLINKSQMRNDALPPNGPQITFKLLQNGSEKTSENCLRTNFLTN